MIAIEIERIGFLDFWNGGLGGNSPQRRIVHAFK